MTAKRRRSRKPRRTRGLAAASYGLVQTYSNFAAQKRCATAISGYGDLKAQREHEDAAHVYQDILRFCVKPQDRR